MSLGSPIQNPSPGPAGLLWHKRHLQPLLAVASALAGYRSGRNLQSLSDPLIGPSVGSVGVGLEQDASVKQLAGMSPAAPQKLFDLLAFTCGEADYVFLVHGEPLAGLVSTREHAHFLLLNQTVPED